MTEEPASSPASPPSGDRLPDAGPPYPPPPPGYVWVRPSPPPRKDWPWRLPRWLKIVTAVWIVALVVGGGWYALHGQPSVREQTTIGNARPVVDRAIVDVVAADGGAPVVAVSGFERVKSCKITPVRSGAEFRRVVDLYTSPGSESAILHMIASHLPARYRAQASSGGSGGSAGSAGSGASAAKLTLDADAGDYVAVDGTVPAPGLIRIVAATGCRQNIGAAVAQPPAAAESTDIAALAPVFGALGRPAASYATVADLACPSGGSLRSVQALLPRGAAPASLATTLHALAATPAASTATVYAYRSGSVDVVAVAEAVTHAVTVTATSHCPA